MAVSNKTLTNLRHSVAEITTKSNNIDDHLNLARKILHLGTKYFRSENASLSRISSQQPSSPTDLPNLDGIRHVLVSDQADRSLEPAAGKSF